MSLYNSVASRLRSERGMLPPRRLMTDSMTVRIYSFRPGSSSRRLPDSRLTRSMTSVCNCCFNSAYSSVTGGGPMYRSALRPGEGEGWAGVLFFFCRSSRSIRLMLHSSGRPVRHAALQPCAGLFFCLVFGFIAFHQCPALSGRQLLDVELVVAGDDLFCDVADGKA